MQQLQQLQGQVQHAPEGAEREHVLQHRYWPRPLHRRLHRVLLLHKLWHEDGGKPVQVAGGGPQGLETTVEVFFATFQIKICTLRRKQPVRKTGPRGPGS